MFLRGKITNKKEQEGARERGRRTDLILNQTRDGKEMRNQVRKAERGKRREDGGDRREERAVYPRQPGPLFVAGC